MGSFPMYHVYHAVMRRKAFNIGYVILAIDVIHDFGRSYILCFIGFSAILFSQQKEYLRGSGLFSSPQVYFCCVNRYLRFEVDNPEIAAYYRQVDKCLLWTFN